MNKTNDFQNNVRYSRDHGLTYGVHTITPKQAKEIIKDQVENYQCQVPVRANPELVTKMRKSERYLSYDPITFLKNGKLFLGLDHLCACIEANKEFRTLIVELGSDDAAVTVGAHRRRTFADLLKIATNSPHPGALAATINNISAMQKRSWTTSHNRGVGVAMNDRYPEIAECVEQAFSKEERVRLVPPAIYATALFMLGRVDAMAAAEFVDLALCRTQHSDESLPSPISVLRTILEGESKKTSKLPTREIMAMIVLAWNAWRRPDKGRGMTKINWGSNGNNKRAFPAIKGWNNKHDINISLEDIALNNEFNDDDIDVELEIITPEDAKLMLEGRARNRNVVPTFVDRIARDIKDNGWDVNGATIKFDTSGKLCDGQHRLTACVKSGKTITSLVARDVNPAAFSTFDVSTTRSFDKYLRSIGQPYATTITAGIKVLINIGKGNLRNSYSPTNKEMKEYYHNNKNELTDFISSCNGFAEICTPCVAFVSVVILHKASESRAKDFLSMLASGCEIPKGCPIMGVRSKLIDNRPSRNKHNKARRSRNRHNEDANRNSGPQAYMYESVALIINGWNSWNAWLEGGKKATRSPKSLDWSAEMGLPFPVPVTPRETTREAKPGIRRRDSQSAQPQFKNLLAAVRSG